MPEGLMAALSDHDVVPCRLMGWGEFENGKLLRAAEDDGFDVMVTADQNILYQQTLTGRRIALVVLSTNFWWTIRGSLDAVREAVNAAHAGSYTTVTLERPPLRRRPYPPPIES
jgi:hypothetical protein